jgi:hypothetical protein
MHGMAEYAAAAAKELEKPPPNGAILAATDQLAVKLQHQFTPELFVGDFWLGVAREMKLTRKTQMIGCGNGHILLFRMRERFRHLRDFARPDKRRELTAQELQERWREVFNFCRAVVKAPLL